MNNNFKNIKPLGNDYDECSIKGICSINPIISSIKTVIYAYLQELSYYIIELDSFDKKNNIINNFFIEVFSVLIANNEYKEDDLLHLIINIQNIINDIKIQYKNICIEKEKSPIFYKQIIKLNQNFNITEVIKQGQRYDEKFKKFVSEENRKGLELILIILKSICLYIIELQSLNIDYEDYYKELVFALSKKGFKAILEEGFDNHIKKYSKIDNEILRLVFDSRKKEFGELTETNISFSVKKGKCILVSGNNFKELELLLEATKDKNINIYTHGQMISSHAYSKFKNYPHLKGHYGKGSEYYVSDFSSFPGPVFVTKLSLYKVENLYSTSVFTTNKIPPLNTRSIVDYNFEPLIESALRSDGFEEDFIEKNTTIGVFEDQYIQKINEIAEKIKLGEIKNIITIGISNNVTDQIDYFKTFFNLVKNDCYIISFFYKSNFKNLLFTNFDYAFPFLYKALDIILPLKDSYNFKINIYNTRCEPHTIPSLFYLRTLNIDNIYFHQCSPLLINPALVNLFIELAKIKLYTNPKYDLEDMIKD